jgi:hypothetical protein
MRALPGRNVGCNGTLPAPIQPEFDFQGLPHAYPLLYVEEAAQQLCCSDQHIRNLIDEGALLAFPINEAAELKRKRNIYRVVRSTCVQDDRLTASGAHDLIRAVNQWLLPSSIGSRSVLTVYETASALRCTGQHIRTLYDAQLLRALDIGSPGSALASLRIARESLVAFVQIRLARQNNLDLNSISSVPSVNSVVKKSGS